MKPTEQRWLTWASLGLMLLAESGMALFLENDEAYHYQHSENHTPHVSPGAQIYPGNTTLSDRSSEPRPF